jgi:hypothetical protein
VRTTEIEQKEQRRRENSPEFDGCPLGSGDASLVELGDGQCDFVRDILIKHSKKDDRKRGKRKVEEDDVRVVEDVRAVEVVVDLEPEEGKRPDEILRSSKMSAL